MGGDKDKQFMWGGGALLGQMITAVHTAVVIAQGRHWASRHLDRHWALENTKF